MGWTQGAGSSSNDGIHFTSPWLMSAHTDTAANIGMWDTAGPSNNDSSTVAFFTGLASFGVTDNTNWTAATYKTIYSHTGAGLIYMMIACTAGGAETTTFEITIDGVLSTITVTNASGQRALLEAAAGGGLADFTTVNHALAAAGSATTGAGLDAGLTTVQASGAASGHMIHPMRWYAQFGVPALRYNISALVRMKHSANITNSTATAYSGVMVRKQIAS